MMNSQARRVAAKRTEAKTAKRASASSEKESSTKKLSKRETERRQKYTAELILTYRENGRKLARSILRRWQVVMPAEEIDSLVDLTLCEAARRYEEAKGASFITFLFYHLRGHLVRAVADATSETNIFFALAQSTGTDTSDWATAQSDSNMLLVVPEIVATQREAETPEVLLMKKEKATLCKDACVQLDELEQQIIDRSYVQDEALVDIAKSLGYSRCHISRVKKRALDRLRGFISERTHEVLPEVEDDEESGTVERVKRRHRRRRIEIRAEQGAEKAAA